MEMLLGAHVSTAGGVDNAPGRAQQIGATAMQIFTKMPNRWAEKVIDADQADAFRRGVEEAGIGYTCAHDSYLINLATPDPVLLERSYNSFRSELERSRLLGLDGIVTHPGNATDGETDRGIEQNARMIEKALREVPESPMVLLETTAGAGQVLGSKFEELATIRSQISDEVRHRVGVCVDTCHIFAAGYDLSGDYEAVMTSFDQTIGLEHLKLFHTNDSQKPLGSCRDRHAEIGEGEIGLDGFRWIMNDARFDGLPRILETPKGDDFVANDTRNLQRLRDLRNG